MSILAAGVVCLIFYSLLALRRPSTFDLGIGNLLFYVGIILLPLGVILLLTGELKSRKK
jgi:hypothetical protein